MTPNETLIKSAYWNGKYPTFFCPPHLNQPQNMRLLIIQARPAYNRNFSTGIRVFFLQRTYDNPHIPKISHHEQTSNHQICAFVSPHWTVDSGPPLKILELTYHESQGPPWSSSTTSTPFRAVLLRGWEHNVEVFFNKNETRRLAKNM